MAGKTRRKIIIAAVLLAAVCVFVIMSLPVIDEPEKNFDYLWKTFDRYYSNFECKDIDWRELYTVYRAKVSSRTRNSELFKIMTELLSHLDDKHVYIRRFNKVYFSGYDLPALNYFRILGFDFRLPLEDFSLKLIRKKYIEGEFKKAFFVAQLNVPPFGFRHVFHYGWLDKSVAYIHMSEMRHDEKKTDEAVKEVMGYFEHARAFIIDIRDNIGGYANPLKESLAHKFADRKRVWTVSYTRNGPAHSDFSEPVYQTIEPVESGSLSHLPVILLTNGNTQSAAELFILMMRVLPNVTVVGDTTMGIFSDTHVNHLPNGWEFRLSIKKTADHEGIWLEDRGITPDVFVKNTAENIRGGRDRVLEKALELVESSEKN